MFVSCLANGCVTSAAVAAAAVLKAPGDKGVNCTFGGPHSRVWPRKEGPVGKGAGDSASSGTLKQTRPSVSGIYGIVDSSSRKNKNQFLSDCEVGCKKKG